MSCENRNKVVGQEASLTVSGVYLTTLPQNDVAIPSNAKVARRFSLPFVFFKQVYQTPTLVMKHIQL